MATGVLHAFFAWLEGICSAAVLAATPAGLARPGSRAAGGAARGSAFRRHLLELAADFELPRYYTGTDIHQHPGGVWSDPPSRALSTSRRAQHDAARGFATRRPARPADRACPARPLPARRRSWTWDGFGKSTRPFTSGCRRRDSCAHLAAPCLKSRARRGRRRRAQRAFRQRRRADRLPRTPSFGPRHLDHAAARDPPPWSSDAAEAARVLKPAQVLPSTSCQDAARRRVRALRAHGHGRRNNDRSWSRCEMDSRATLSARVHERRNPGFGGGQARSRRTTPSWRFPWT